jgi:uracil permease
VAVAVVISIIIVSVFAKGFFKLVPILIGIAVGYGFSMFSGLIDYSVINQASWFEIPKFMLPKFSWPAILTVAPVAFVTFMEHIGDITTNSAVVEKDFLKDPGLARTLIGDGLATSFAGLVGGPANTTYSENTGVLAVTKVYNPVVLEIAALAAILMAFIGKFGAVLQTIPVPVMGGVSLILFGMIASIGMRTISEAKLDFSQSRNLIIVSLILVIGLAGELIAIKIGGQPVKIGLFTAALVGVVLNKILPEGI